MVSKVSRGSSSWGAALVVSGVLGCGSAGGGSSVPPPPTSPPMVAAPSSSASAQALVAGPPPAETKCERAKRWVAEARELEQAGWLRRPLRLLERAATTCLAEGDPQLLEALKLAAKPGPSEATLFAQLTTAREQGDALAARKLAARWAAAAEATAGSLAELVPRPSEELVGFSADGAAVIMASNSGLIVVDATTGLPRQFIATPDRVHYATIDGDRLLTIAPRGIDVASLKTGSSLQQLSWTSEAYRWAAFWKGGTRVVAVGSRSWDGVVRVFDVATGNNVGDLNLQGSEPVAHAAQLGDDGLVVATRDAVLVVDLLQMKVTHTLDLVPPGQKPSMDEVVSLATASPKTVAVATRRGRLLAWQLPSKTPLLDRATGSFRAAVALSADGQKLYAALQASSAGEIRTIDVKSGTALKSHPSHGSDVAFAAHGKRAFVSAYSQPARLLDDKGADLWSWQKRDAEIGGLALSRGLMLTHANREGSESFTHVHAWYRGHARHFQAEGYRADVLALSPSGRYAAAVVSRQGKLWALHTGAEETFSTANASGFPEALAFEGDETLWLALERPATAWSARYPFGHWEQHRAAATQSGFSGLQLSAAGVLVTSEDGALMLALPEGGDRPLLQRGLGGYKFSGDGETLVASEDKTLLWFDGDGRRVGEHGLPCAPTKMGVDQTGALVAFVCDNQLVTLRGRKVVRSAPLTVSSVDDVQVAPDGHLIAIRADEQVVLFNAESLARVATITLRGGEALVTGAAGRVMFWSDSPSWMSSTACRIGRRGYPADMCLDAVMDDALLDGLLAPP